MKHSSSSAQKEVRMTPAFQVLLCLCLLGMSYAAPQARNVRWCVTSNAEEKKCNDLVNSCTVKEIVLICVKKSSTEDCMRAISAGEADAISLDSENIYKASLNPFDLKPIMTETYPSQKEIKVNQGPCQKERQRQRERGRPLLGAFEPKCDEKGNYQPKQCHGSTGYCWCVNEEGKTIDGTKTPPGQKSVTCEDHQQSTPCLRHRQSVLGANKPQIGAFVPDCDEKGNYSPKQCFGSTGYCWCVDEHGDEIEGVRAKQGKVNITCEYTGGEKPCMKERRKSLSGGQPLPGAFMPDCDEKGNYSPKQCHGSTGYCWCVNENGKEISGSRTPPGQQVPTCGASVLSAETSCIKERQKVLGAATPILGAFVPDCDAKGDYRPKQCHGSTGHCWCVSKDGKEIQGTRTAPGQTPPTCEIPGGEKPCMKERRKSLSGGQPLPGAFMPDCDEKGNYSPKQCHGSTGYCWCVNENGKEISGSRTPPGQQVPTCGASVLSAETSCIKERQKVLGAEKPILGAFVPDCDEKGDYRPKQCHSSTGHCWCVSKDGKEIQGTRTAPGQTPPTCEIPGGEKPCMKERQKSLSGGQPLPGAFMPDCDEKGNYSPKQCHGSTGYCWCVNENGKEISGSRTPPGQQVPTCGASVLSADTSCIKERQKVLGAEKPILGAFEPDCDEKGDYRPKQCHGSTGHCWCVSKDGKEIQGTRTARGQSPPTCEIPVLSAETSCIKERQKVLGAATPILGAFVPDCDEKGDYRPKQCHGSTGHCWCVSKDGKEIQGTRAAPGQTPPTCEDRVLSAETSCIKERQKVLGAATPILGAFVPDCDEKGEYRPKQCHGSTGHCWCVSKDGKEIQGTRAGPGQTPPTCEDTAETSCIKERQKVLGAAKPILGAFVPDCDEKGEYRPKQCHGSTGHCWCVSKDGKEIQGTRAAPRQSPPTCEIPAETSCIKEQQKVRAGKPILGAFVPDCDEKGDYRPKQCHGSTGHCWCVSKDGKEIQGTRAACGQSPPTCEIPAETSCIKERQKVLGAEKPILGAFVPDCDEKGEYRPKQCHGSTGHCWCVSKDGKEIQGTRAGPGQSPPTCEDTVLSAETSCIKERQKVLGAATPILGAFVPDCDEKGDYRPKQCHGSTGHCWCVSKDGKEIQGTRAGPGQSPPTCEIPAEKSCIKERQKVRSPRKPILGAFVPDCDEKGDYRPKQCHSSTGHCWCVSKDGKEIQGTRAARGQSPPTCEDPDPVTCHYAVAVVKKSSTLQFNQLKGKRSCHSAVGKTASWIAPLYKLYKKNLLLWEKPEEKSFEKAASEFFSVSCAPGAKEENLCKQCAGKEEKCKRSPGEPYYGDEGALRCLRDDKGDVAFVEHTALSGQDLDNFELLCPDNTRSPLSEHKHCHFGKVPRHAVVTKSTGDKSKDIIEYLLEAQKKGCKLFSSTHGKDLIFEHTTKNLIALPSAMNTFLFLGPELFDAMKTLHGAPLPSKNEVRWCTQNKKEKTKCDDWSSVSGGAIKCTEPSSVQQCIEKILKHEADAVTLSAEHMYTALKCGLVPAIDEYHNKDDLAPCKTLGDIYTDFGTPRAVALVKKSDKGITWNNLKGKKSCHTGVGHMAGWVIPLSLISKQTNNCDMGSYFSQSCAPGSAIDSNLCKLCIGDPQNTKAQTKCSPSDKEAYFGSAGAIRCLVEKGDVAFLPHTAVIENTDGNNPALWAKDLKSTDFELLCPDGSRAPVTDYKNCKLLSISSPSVVTREESVSDVVRIVLNQQSLFGQKGFEKDIFQMFSSSNGKNLLFSDGTQCLLEFDRIIGRDIMEDYFGKRFHTAVHRDNQCLPTSEFASACAFHHC
ncbi:thyroglobulin-like isoform X2 [Bufo gargarizans]|uniref:thyroglobulin-like isoform X2 n=1 Tax=Bufo gargarizans TaxID=30331 RepID=UPI001CF4D061|nr:thyroglobulin-like isoform X2 [Bufo gargarizans]